MTASAEFSAHFPALAQELGPDNLRLLLESMSVLELPAYRKMIRDRMPVDSLYFLVEGEVSISVEENESHISLGELGPGQWLGEVSVLSGEMLASSTVTTLTPVKLLRLKHQAFEEIMTHYPAISGVLLRHLTEMLTERLLASLAAGTAPIAADGSEATPKRRGLLWALFGGNGG
jgi:CRP-like cAMP-binding protein